MYSFIIVPLNHLYLAISKGSQLLKPGVVLFFGVLLLTGCSNPPAVQPDAQEIAEQTVPAESPADTIQVSLVDLEHRYDQSFTRQDNRIRIVEDRTRYIDSVYFELSQRVQKLEDELEEMKQGVRSGTPEGAELPPVFREKLSDEEYRLRYIDALANYQNGNYDAALKMFRELLVIDTKHDLSDNCQYWIGEIYYAQKDFRKALSEFMKVRNFPGTNKADHALFKIGLCYLNIGDTEKAVENFREHVSLYPNSEHYSTSKKYIDQY